MNDLDLYNSVANDDLDLYNSVATGTPAQPKTEVPSLPTVFGGADSIPNPGNITGGSTPLPTQNNDGTISTLTTGQPEDKQGTFKKDIVDRAVDITGQVVAGARKPIVGAAIVASDIADTIFDTEYAKAPRETAAKLQSFTEKYNKAHPDEAIHPSTVGELAFYDALPVTRAVLADTSIIGGAAFLDALGSNKDYEDATVESAATMALAGVSIGILNKIFPPNGKNGLTHEAKLILDLNRGRITQEEAVKLLSDIPKKEQALTLAERIDLANKYIIKSIENNNELAAKYGERLESSKNKLEQLRSTPEDLKAAETRYSDMRAKVNEEVPDKVTLNFNPDELNDIVDIYKTDISGVGTTLKAIQQDLGKEDLTLSSLLDIRENLNTILRKPSVKNVGRSTDNLVKLKGVLDGQIEETLKTNPQLSKDIYTAIDDFRITKTNYKLGELIDKNTKGNYAVDYEKLAADIEKEGLYSDNVIKYAKPILKEFSKKFKTDKFMGDAITPKGLRKESALSILSKVYEYILDKVSPIFNRPRYNDLKITKAIVKAIKKADPERPLGFVEDLINNEKLGEVIDKESLIKSINTPVKLLDYKVGKGTGDVNLKPIYTTEKGTAGTEPSKLALKDAQDKLIKDFVANPAKAEDVSKTLNKFVDSKRLETQMSNSAARMKIGETKKNAEMLKKIFENEAKTIVKNIEKEHGIKMPPEEVQKILKIKANQLMEACNK